MIVSASRRTDIPAFYGDWFMGRVREGYCVNRNPFNSTQVNILSLRPEDVEVIVFWSKNPAPFFRHLPELDRKGFRYYFHFTLNDYPAELEPNLPPLEKRLETFRKLSETIGRERVIWRYDPVIISNVTCHDYHRKSFAELCGKLEGLTERVMTSLVTWYKKTKRNLSALERRGYRFDENAVNNKHTDRLFYDMSGICGEHSMEIYTCSMERDYSNLGVSPGHCIDATLINRLWNLDYPDKKDPGQRKDCGCAVSRDIGVADTCVHGCHYCYSTKNFKLAKTRHEKHEPWTDELFSGGLAAGLVERPVASPAERFAHGGKRGKSAI